MLKFKSIYWLLLCSLIICCINGCDVLKEDITNATITQGNTNGNIHNTGWILIDNGWIYYSNANDSGQLYKKRLDGSKKKQLVKGHHSYNLNLIGNYIYYISGGPGMVYRIDTNGKKDELLIDKRAENLIVTNEYIFYRLSDDNDWGKLYRTDLNGKNEILLANSIIEFAISNGWLYYSNREDDSSLYKMNFSGGNITKLNSEHSSDINVEGDYVYYTDYNDGQKLYRIKIDGTDKVLLSNDMCWGINLYQGYIYYRNQTYRGQIHRIKTNGAENNIIICEENCGAVNVVENFIFYAAGDWKDYKANLDGSNIEKWEESY